MQRVNALNDYDANRAYLAGNVYLKYIDMLLEFNNIFSHFKLHFVNKNPNIKRKQSFMLRIILFHNFTNVYIINTKACSFKYDVHGTVHR
jgi:hypothetical protein